jgi:hypothetical protein
MKNPPKSGRSARRGNKPAPYTKYGKTPYKYDFQIRRKQQHQR